MSTAGSNVNPSTGWTRVRAQRRMGSVEGFRDDVGFPYFLNVLADLINELTTTPLQNADDTVKVVGVNEQKGHITDSSLGRCG